MPIVLRTSVFFVYFLPKVSSDTGWDRSSGSGRSYGDMQVTRDDHLRVAKRRGFDSDKECASIPPASGLLIRRMGSLLAGAAHCHLVQFDGRHADSDGHGLPGLPAGSDAFIQREIVAHH